MGHGLKIFIGPGYNTVHTLQAAKLAATATYPMPDKIANEQPGEAPLIRNSLPLLLAP